MMFIGGQFFRGEGGRDLTVLGIGRVLRARGIDRALLANYCRASRKDFRDVVVAARNAFAGWSKQSAYLRGQILYRAAEMLEMRGAELETELTRSGGRKNGKPAE